MSKKLKKTLALVLSLVTVFSAAFTSMAEIKVVEEIQTTDQVEVIEEVASVTSGLFNAADIDRDIQVVEVTENQEVSEITTSYPEIDAIESGLLGTEIPVSSWFDLNRELSSSGGTEDAPVYITLDGNITAAGSDQAIIVGGYKILILNGHTINRNLDSSSKPDGYIFMIPAVATLTITGNGTLTGGSSSTAGAIDNYGTLILENVTITGNHSENSSDGQGGAIYNATNATFTMNGGTISSNSATGNGGGVYNAGSFTMNSGTISGNSATNDGGGVYNTGSFTMNSGTISGDNPRNTAVNGGGIYNTGTFTMTNGTITDNNTAVNGGGVYNAGTYTMEHGAISGNGASGNGAGVYNANTFTMKDGSFSGNIAGTNGGAIMITAAGQNTVLTGGSIKDNRTTGEGTAGGGIWTEAGATLGGKLVITNNYQYPNSVNNVSLSGNCKITLATGSQAPAEGMQVGITLQTTYGTGIFTDTNEGYKDYAGYFFSDNSSFCVRYKATDKGLTITPPVYTVTYDANGATGGTVPTDSNTYASGTEVTVLGNTGSLVKNGSDFNGWNTKADGTGTDYSAGNSFSITGNTVLYAKWLKVVTEISVPAGLPGVKYEVKDVTDPQNPVTLSPKAGTMAGASAYDVKIGAKIEITAIPAEGYEVTGTNPYVIEKVTTETVVNPEDLPSVQSKQQGSKITFSAGSGVKSAAVYSKMTGGTQTFTSDQFPVTLPIPAGEEIIIKSVECESGYTCDLTLPYTYIVPDHDDTFTISAKKNTVRSTSNEEREPLYTGTWNAPVKSGSWSQDAHGIWHYSSSETFRNTWGYIVNPYAGEGQNSADWFWFDIHGNMLTGWQFINGKWYYLNPTKDGTLGACQLGGITPDGWTVDESGAWIESIPRSKFFR